MDFNKIVLSWLVYSQTWLNLLVDDRQCGNITKLKGKQNKNTEIHKIEEKKTLLLLCNILLNLGNSCASHCEQGNYIRGA
jgi:hypothetical protein